MSVHIIDLTRTKRGKACLIGLQDHLCRCGRGRRLDARGLRERLGVEILINHTTSHSSNDSINNSNNDYYSVILIYYYYYYYYHYYYYKF